MGSVISNIQHVIVGDKDPPTPEFKILTPRQIEIVKKSWAIPYSKPLDSGELVLYTFFEKFPQNQQMFQAFRNTPLIMLKGTPGFRSHAHKIMRVFASAIDLLGTENDLNLIETVIVDMSKYHKRRSITKRNFIELRSVLVEILAQVCKLDDEGCEAWNDLLDTIYHIIFNVLDEAKANKK